MRWWCGLTLPWALLALVAPVGVQASSSLEWVQLPASVKPPPRANYAVASFGSTIYVHGGLWQGKMMLSDLWRLDTTQSPLAWEKLSAGSMVGHDFPTTRQRHSMMLSPDGGVLYIFGGMAHGFEDTDDTRDQGAFFRLDLTHTPLMWEESWAKLPHADSAMVWWGSQPLVYGGFCKGQEDSDSCEANWLHTLDIARSFSNFWRAQWAHQAYVGQPPPVTSKPVMVVMDDLIYVMSPDRFGFEPQDVYTLTPTSCSSGTCPLQWGVLVTANKGPLHADSMVAVGNVLWVWGGIHNELFRLDLGGASPLSWDDATPSASVVPSNVEEGQSKMVAVDEALVAFAGIYDLEAFRVRLQCSPGTFGAEGSIHCEACPSGTFSPAYGATSCTQNMCFEGECLSDACSQCAAGLCAHGLEYSCPPSSRNDTLCIQCTQDPCAPGEFRTGCADHADSFCKKCSAGGCGVGEYRSACTNTSDGICTKCTEGGCGAGMFRTACTQDADGVCMRAEAESAAILSVRLDCNATTFSRLKVSFLLSVSRVLQQDPSTIAVLNFTLIDVPERRAGDGNGRTVLEVVIAVQSSGPAGIALIESKLTPISMNAQLEADRVQIRAVQKPPAAPQPGPDPDPGPPPPPPPQPSPPPPQPSPQPLRPTPGPERPRDRGGPDGTIILLWVLLALGVSALALIFVRRSLQERRRRLEAGIDTGDGDGVELLVMPAVIPAQTRFQEHEASAPATEECVAPAQPTRALSSNSSAMSQTTASLPAALQGQVQESVGEQQWKSASLKKVDLVQKDFAKSEYYEAGASMRPPKAEGHDSDCVSAVKDAESFDEGGAEAAGAREGAAQNPRMESS